MFLLKKDLIVAISEDELDEITRKDEAIVQQAMGASISTMMIYLFDGYDTESIFAQTGAARHALLLQTGVDIAIYFVTGRGQAGQNVDDRKSRYDRAIKLLEAFKKTETYSDLPRRDARKEQGFSLKSNPKRNNYF